MQTYQIKPIKWEILGSRWISKTIQGSWFEIRELPCGSVCLDSWTSDSNLGYYYVTGSTKEESIDSAKLKAQEILEELLAPILEKHEELIQKNLAPTAGFSIKPLEWIKQGAGYWMAHSAIGAYEIAFNKCQWTLSNHNCCVRFNRAALLGSFDLLEEAQKAGQEDFEKVIQSVLVENRAGFLVWEKDKLGDSTARYDGGRYLIMETHYGSFRLVYGNDGEGFGRLIGEFESEQLAYEVAQKDSEKSNRFKQFEWQETQRGLHGEVGGVRALIWENDGNWTLSFGKGNLRTEDVPVRSLDDGKKLAQKMLEEFVSGFLNHGY